MEELFSDGIQVIVHDKTEQISIRKSTQNVHSFPFSWLGETFCMTSWNLLKQSDLFFFSLILSWQSDVIETLRHQHSKDLQKVVDIVLSHQVNFFMADDF